MRREGLFVVCLVLVLGFAATFGPCFGATSVSGTVNSNETWNLAGSPYVLTGDLTVANGATLTIDAGVVVKVTLTTAPSVVHHTLNVYGTLTVNGTAAEPVSFTSYYDDTVGGDTNGDGGATIPARGDWNYIYIANNGGTLLGTGSFTYCNFKYGGYGVYGTLYSSGAPVSLTHCSVVDSASAGYYLASISSALDLSNCSATNCTGKGFNIDRATSCSLTDCTATACGSDGFHFEYGTVTGLTRVTATSCNSYPLSFNGTTLRTDFSGVTTSGCTPDAVALNSVVIAQNASWSKISDTTPYVSNGFTLNNGINLTLQPGVVIKANSLFAVFNIYGGLTANGTASEKVYFTGYKDDSVAGNTDGTAASPAAGDWGYIYIWNDGVNHLGSANFNNCVFKYGGRNGSGMVSCTNAPVSITNCTVSYSSTAGLYLQSNVTPTISDCTVTDCTAQGIYLYGIPNAVLTNCTVQRCAGAGIYFYSGQVAGLTGVNVSDCNSYPLHFYSAALKTGFGGVTTSACVPSAVMLENSTVSASSDWGVIPGCGAYLTTGLTLSKSVSLNLQPGVVMKMSPLARVYIYGDLTANGTAAQPIYFTSYRDDSVGGDTDGVVATPAAGDWGYVNVSNNGSSSLGSAILARCVFKYGGGGGASGALYSQGAAVTVTNSQSSGSLTSGFYFSAGTPTVSDCVVSDCAGKGIYFASVTNAGLTNCTVERCADSGIYFSGGQVATLTGINVNNCNSYPVYIQSATLKTGFSGVTTSGCVPAAMAIDTCAIGVDSTWGPVPGCDAYVTGTTTLNKGINLTIQPGMVLKAKAATKWNVYGGLTANGAATQPIYFTSIKDDSVGGDTDRVVATPAAGDWGYLNIDNDAVTYLGSATLDHCVLKYGGAASGSGMVQTSRKGTLAVSNSEISRSSTSGIFASLTNSSISATNCTISNCAVKGISVSGTGTATIKNCIVTNNQTGVYAAAIVPAVTYCDVWSNTTADYTGSTAGAGCVSLDPLYMSSVNRYLRTGSPCIDTGDPALLDSDGSRSDMGCYPYCRDLIFSAKSLKDGSLVSMTDKVVTAVLSDRFYVEEKDKFSGIAIMGVGVGVGDEVDIQGTTATIGGEKCIKSPVLAVVLPASLMLDPVCLNNTTIGGGDYNYVLATKAGQRGVNGGTGLNNIGVLAMLSGKCTYVDAHTFLVDDGGISGGVKCVTPASVTVSPSWQYVAVTGISSCEESGVNLFPMLRVRGTEDIVPL